MIDEDLQGCVLDAYGLVVEPRTPRVTRTEVIAFAVAVLTLLGAGFAWGNWWRARQQQYSPAPEVVQLPPGTMFHYELPEKPPRRDAI